VALRWAQACAPRRAATVAGGAAPGCGFLHRDSGGRRAGPCGNFHIRIRPALGPIRIHGRAAEPSAVAHGLRQRVPEAGGRVRQGRNRPGWPRGAPTSSGTTRRAPVSDRFWHAPRTSARMTAGAAQTQTARPALNRSARHAC
jgi:hypothetical protein